MRPKKHETTGSADLFRARLDQIINMRHELVQLAGKIDWEFVDGEIAPLYSDGGRPGIATQFVIGLFLLKHIYGLSDEGVCERWVYDPYFQHFTGEEFFQHEFPHERSDLSHWRKRLGGKLELLLAESLRVAHESGALRTKDLARVTVDTTVQPKDITFPTDAKLLHAAIKGLTRLARKRGVRLRQSYVRIAKRAAMMAGRYAHAKQFNRHRRQLRILRTRLGRLIRDIRRKIAGNADLEAVFAWPLSRADQIRSQQQRQRGWRLYSFHAPEVECIGKGTLSMDYNLFFAQSRAVFDPRRYQTMREQTLQTYLHYFKTNYAGNRAPLHIGHHFMNYGGGAYNEALKAFARAVCGLPEVRCVTYAKLADFMDQQNAETLAAYRKGDFARAATPALNVAEVLR